MALFRRGKDPKDTTEDHPQQDHPQGPGAETVRTGPLDRTDVPGLEDRIDLGSLWLPAVDGMELRLELDQTTNEVVGVSAALGESALQLQAFAAPRTLGIWDDIRTEIAESLVRSGGEAQEVDGPFGTELAAGLPQQDAYGRRVTVPVRFLGVDGPRWFLRGFLSGPAVTDPAQAEVLLDVFRGAVVVRGDAAMAPRDLLPLRIPDQPQVRRTSPGPDEAPGGADDDRPRTAGDLGVLERGPEITEVH